MYILDADKKLANNNPNNMLNRNTNDSFYCSRLPTILKSINNIRFNSKSI